MTTDNLRDRLVEKATEVLESDGPDGFTLRAVARAAGVAIGTVQYHFATKDLLVEEVVGRALGGLLDLAGATLGAPLAGSPDDVLAAVITRAYHTARSRRTAIRLNIIDALTRGGLSPRRREDLERVLAVASALAPAFGGVQAARLLAQTLVFAIARYATATEEELRQTIGDDSLTSDQLHARVARHLVDVVASSRRDPA